MATLERAIAIAAEAHSGTFDDAGDPYIFHPLRVMMHCAGKARIVAALHDVVERTATTLHDLRSAGFSEEIVSGVDAISRREGEDYFDFVRRAIKHPLAREVKRADLHDNISLVQKGRMTKDDAKHLERYQKALEIIAAVQ